MHLAFEWIGEDDPPKMRPSVPGSRTSVGDDSLFGLSFDSAKQTERTV